MLEGSEAARKFIDTMIDAKLDGTEIEPDVRVTLRENLLKRLESQIIRAVIRELDANQQRELEHLIDTNKAEEISGYLEKNGVNMNQLLAGVMTDFQAAYLGA